MSNTRNLTKLASLHSLLMNVKRDITSLMQQHHKIEGDLESVTSDLENPKNLSKTASLKTRKNYIKTAGQNVINKIAALVKQASTLEMHNDRALRLMFLDGAYAYKENPGQMERILDLMEDLTSIKKEVNAEKELDLSDVDNEGQKYDEKRVEYANLVNELSSKANLNKYKKFTRGGKVVKELEDVEPPVEDKQLKSQLENLGQNLNSFMDNLIKESSKAINKVRNDLRVNSRSEYDSKVEREAERLEKELEATKKKRTKLFEMLNNFKVSMAPAGEEGEEISHEFTLNLIKNRVKRTVGNENGTGGISEYFTIIEEGIKQLGGEIDEEYLTEQRSLLKKRIEDVLDPIDPGVRAGKILKSADITNLKLIIFLDRLLKKININLSTVSLALIDYMSNTQDDSLAVIKYTPTGSFENINLSARDLAALKVRMKELADLGKGEKLGVLERDEEIYKAFRDLTGFSSETLEKFSSKNSEVGTQYTRWVNSWLGRTNQGWYKAIMSSIDSYTRNLKTAYFDREDVYQNLFYGISKSQGEKLKTTGSTEDSAEYFIDPMFLAGLLTCSPKTRKLDVSNSSHTLKQVMGVVGKQYLWSEGGNKVNFIESSNNAIITFIRNKTNKIAGTLVRKRTEITMYELTESGTLLTPNDYNAYVDGLLGREGLLAKATPRERASLRSKKKKDLQRLKQIKEIRVKLYEGSIDSPIVGQGGEVYDESGAGRVEDTSASLGDMGGQKGSFEYQDTLTSATVFDKGGYSANQIYLDMLSGDRTRLTSLVNSYRDRVVDLLNRNPSIQESLIEALRSPGMEGVIPSYVLDSENLFTPQNLTFYRVPVRNRVNSYLIPKKKRELEVNKLKTSILLASEKLFEGADVGLREEIRKINPDALTFVGLINTLTDVRVIQGRDGKPAYEAGQLVELEKLLESMNKDAFKDLDTSKVEMEEAALKLTSVKSRKDALDKLIEGELKGGKIDGKWSVSQIGAIMGYFKNPVFAYSFEKIQGLTEAEIFEKINTLDLTSIKEEQAKLAIDTNEAKEKLNTAKAKYFGATDAVRGLEYRQDAINNLLDLSVKMGVSRLDVKSVLYSLKSPEELEKEIVTLDNRVNSLTKDLKVAKANLEELLKSSPNGLEIPVLRLKVDDLEKEIMSLDNRIEVLETDKQVREEERKGESFDKKRQRDLKRKRYEELLAQQTFEEKLHQEELSLSHFEEKLNEGIGTEDEDFFRERVNKQRVLVQTMRIKSTHKNIPDIKEFVKDLTKEAKNFDAVSDIPQAQDNYIKIISYLNQTAKRLSRFETERDNIHSMLGRLKSLKETIDKLGPKTGNSWKGGAGGGQYGILREYLLNNTSELDNKTPEEERAIIESKSPKGLLADFERLDEIIKRETSKNETDRRYELISQYRDMQKKAQEEDTYGKPFMSYADPKVVFSKIEKMLLETKKTDNSELAKEYNTLTSYETILGDERVKPYQVVKTRMEELWNKIRVYSATIERTNVESKIAELRDRMESLEEEKLPTYEVGRLIVSLTNYLNKFVKDNGIEEGEALKGDAYTSVNFELVTYLERYIGYMVGMAPMLLARIKKKQKGAYSDHRKTINTNPNLVSILEGRIGTLREKHISVLYGDKKKSLVDRGLEIDSDILKLHSVSNVFNDYDGAVNMNAGIMATSEIIRNDMRHLLSSDTVVVPSVKDDVLARKLWDFYFDLIKVSGDEALAVKDLDEKIKEIDGRLVTNREEMFKIYLAIKNEIARANDPSLNVIVDTIAYMENQKEVEPAPELNLDQNQKKSLVNRLKQIKKVDDDLLEEKKMEVEMKVSLNGLRRIQNMWRVSQVHGLHFQQLVKVDTGAEGTDLVIDRENQDYYKNLLAIVEGDVDPWNQKFMEVMLEKKKEDMRQDLNDAREEGSDASIGSQFVNKRIATVVCEALRVFAKKSTVKNSKGEQVLAPWMAAIQKDPRKAKSIGMALYSITRKAKEIREYVLRNAKAGDKATRSSLSEFMEISLPKSFLSDFTTEAKMTQKQKLDTAKSRELNKEEIDQLKNYLDYLRPKEGKSLPNLIQEIMGERAKALFNPDKAASSVYNNLPSLPIQFGFINEDLSESSDVLMRVSRKKSAKKQGEVISGKSRGKFRLTQLNALKGSFIGSSFGNSIAVAKSTEQLFDKKMLLNEIESTFGGIGLITAKSKKNLTAVDYFTKGDGAVISDFRDDLEHIVAIYEANGGVPSSDLQEPMSRILTALGVSNEDLQKGSEAEIAKKKTLRMRIFKVLTTLGRNSCGRAPGNTVVVENSEEFLQKNMGLGKRDSRGFFNGYIYSLYSKSGPNFSLSPEVRKILSQMDCFFIEEKTKKTKPVCAYNIYKLPKNLKLACKVRKDLLTLVEKHESKIADLRGMIREARLERDKLGDELGKSRIKEYVHILNRTKFDLLDDILDIKGILDIQSVPEFCDIRIQELNSRFNLMTVLNQRQPTAERAEEIMDIQREINLYDERRNGRKDENGKRVSGGVVAEIQRRISDFEKEKQDNPSARAEFSDLSSFIGDLNTRYSDVFKSYNLIDPSIVTDFWDLVKQERKLKDIRIPIQIDFSELNVEGTLRKLSNDILVAGLYGKEATRENIEAALRPLYSRAITNVFNSLNQQEFNSDVKTKSLTRLLYIDETVTFYSVMEPILTELNKLKNGSESLMDRLQNILFIGRDRPKSEVEDERSLDEIIADRKRDPEVLVPSQMKGSPSYTKEMSQLEKEIQGNEELITHLKHLIQTYGEGIIKILSDYARNLFWETKTKITNQ